MRKTLSIIILFSTLIATSQERDCVDFKEGEFRYVKESMLDRIVRTKSLQIETNPNDKIIIKTSIDWLSDCEYILTYVEILNHPKDVSSLIGRRIYCEIIEIKGNRYKVHAKSDRVDDVIEFVKVD